MIISTYTHADAVRDGIQLQIGPQLWVTTAWARKVAAMIPDAAAPPMTMRGNGDEVEIPRDIDAFELQAMASMVVEWFNKGIYAWPESADVHGEADRGLALYDVKGVRTWAIEDGSGLTILLPSDY